MSKILMVASEANPFAKTGGLADVVGALSPTLRARGENVAIVMPRYRGISIEGADLVFEGLRVFAVAPHNWITSIYRLVERGVPYYLVDCPELFQRDTLYGDAQGDYPDNHIRFGVFAHAVLAIIRYLYRPDVVHCHDWQSALVPIYMRTRYRADATFMGLKTLFTIHNLGYQGLFPRTALAELGLDDSLFTMDGLEFYGQVNLLKGGLVYSDALSTVSKGYAREIQTKDLGFGLEGILKARSSVLCGILNGVDYTEWDPATDRCIARNYSPSDPSGKTDCKCDLLREFGLPEDALKRPVIGIVSRFAGQKGFDLIEDAAEFLAAENLSIVALGTGDARYEKLFLDLAASYPTRIAVRIAYDNALAHKIEAGADMFLMPSRYEPCGLNQIYSLRYGTVPVVRATGGLDDTIDKSTGFKFREYTAEAMLDAIHSALAAWRNRKRWQEMMVRGMLKDFSWNASAAEYSALYAQLAG